jgi:hypothetical protein
LVLAKPSGSKPTSPTSDPSKAAGRSIKGSDSLILGKGFSTGVGTSGAVVVVVVSSDVTSAMRKALLLDMEGVVKAEAPADMARTKAAENFMIVVICNVVRFMDAFVVWLLFQIVRVVGKYADLQL